MEDVVLAADLGGTNLRIAAVSRDGTIRARGHRPTPRDADALAIVNAIVELSGSVRRDIDSQHHVVSVGVAAPVSAMIVDEGIILKAPNLPMLDGYGFRRALGEGLGLPVIVENDANSAAVGEHWLGASRTFANSVCITLGTGVGGGIILNDELLRGPDGAAGEIGHICVEPRGHACGCGSRGCVEQYSSATAVAQLARELAAAEPVSMLNGKQDLTSLDVFEAASSGDAIARSAFETMGYYLGIALADLVNILNPDAFILAGGLTGAWQFFIDSTRGEMLRRAFREPAERVKLGRAELGDDAGILGMARLAFNARDQGTLAR